MIWHAGKIGRDGEWIKKYMNNHGVRVDHIIISEDQVRLIITSYSDFTSHFVIATFYYI